MGFVTNTAYTALDSQSNSEVGKYSESPFYFMNGSNEGISYNTGALAYEDKIATIPGPAGLDLELALQYSSDTASSQTAYVETGCNLLGYALVIKAPIGWNFDPYFLYSNHLSFLCSEAEFYDVYYWSGADYDTIAMIEGYPLRIFADVWSASYASQGAAFQTIITLSPYFMSYGAFEIYSYYANNAIRFVPTSNPIEYVGDGWSFKFSRVFKENDYTYLRLTNGATYLYQSTYPANNSSNLKDYPGLDIVFTTDNASEYPGSWYKLAYNNGRKEYFNQNGRIIGIADRFGNQIKFTYMSGVYGSGSIVIADKNNQQLASITYTNTLVEVLLPEGKSVEYTLTSSINSKTLTQKKDQLGRFTTFEYANSPAKYNFITRRLDLYYVTIYQNILTAITYPTGVVSRYTFEKATGTVGITEGLFEYYRLIDRKDEADGRNCNHTTYAYYSANYTGYPQYRICYQLPFNYTYKTTISGDTGVSTTYTFNNYHLLVNSTTSVASVKNQEESFVYDTYKHLTSRVRIFCNGSINRTATELFTYDQYGNLTAYWDAQAEGNRNDILHKTTYTYGANGTYYGIPFTVSYMKDAVTAITLTNSISSDWPTSGKTIGTTQVSSSGSVVQQTEFTYDIYGNVLTKKDYKNPTEFIQTTNIYQNGVFLISQAVGSVENSFTYDAYGRILTAKDGNNNLNNTNYVTSYLYDAVGRLTKRTNPDNTIYTVSFNDTAKTMITTNEICNTIKTTYNSLGYPTKIDDITSVTTITLCTYTYDLLGRLETETDSRGTKTTYTYDYLDRILTKSINSIPSYSERYQYEDGYSTTLSKVSKIIDGEANAPSEKTVTYTDTYGFVTQSGYVLNGAEILDTYTYDYLGNQITATTPNNFTTTFQYDALRRLIKTINPDSSIYQSAYDWLGNKISTTDPIGAIAAYQYDAQGLVTQETLPFDGSYSIVIKYTYDHNSNMTRREQTNNKPGTAQTWSRTDYTYNTRNFLTRTTSYNGAAVDNYVDYEYDAVGNMTKMKTANGALTTSYEYYPQSRLKKMTDPLNQSESYTYDNNGNITTKTDRNGMTLYYEHDFLNRLIKIWDGPASAAPTVTTNYAKTGAVLSEVNDDLTTSYVYDSAGRLIKETETGYAGGTVVKDYTYDARNNRVTFVLWQNNTQKMSLSYAYDSMNRLTQVKNGSVVEAEYTYDANGNRAAMAYPVSCITTTYGYNKANLVTSLVNKKGLTELTSYTYTYYLDGNQASKTEKIGSASPTTTSYEYDGLGRLLNETERLQNLTLVYSNVYTYNNVGNRAAMTVSGQESYGVTYAYDANNRLTKDTKTAGSGTGATVSVTDYYYDNNGNQVGKTSSTIGPASGGSEALGIYSGGTGGNDGFSYELDEYDLLGRLAKVTNENTVATYKYKANGLRMSKTTSLAGGAALTVNDIWDGSNVIAEADANGNITDLYVRGINLVKRMPNIAADYRYYLYNAHGDVTQLTGSTGTVMKNYKYDAFGVEVDLDESDQNPFKYCGEYFDSETGTYYLRARYYNPRTGRFTQEDSIRSGLNYYTYCINNPVMCL